MKPQSIRNKEARQTVKEQIREQRIDHTVDMRGNPLVFEAVDEICSFCKEPIYIALAQGWFNSDREFAPFNKLEFGPAVWLEFYENRPFLGMPIEKLPSGYEEIHHGLCWWRNAYKQGWAEN